MDRIATQKLVDWNNNKRKKPLIVWGARQVGKTYLIKDIFAEKYYKDNYIYIDCKIEDEISEFCSNTIKCFMMLLNHHMKKRQRLIRKFMNLRWNRYISTS